MDVHLPAEPILQVAAVQLRAEAILQVAAVQVEVTHPAEDIPAVVAAHVQADLPPEGNH